MSAYTRLNFLDAYFAWVHAPIVQPYFKERHKAWDHYIDVRDNLKPGTTERIRLAREKDDDTEILN